MRRSRRTAVRFVSAVVLFTVTAGGIAVAGSFHISQRFDEIGRIDLGAALQPAKDEPGITSAQNYLLVGSDSRAGANPGDADYGAMGNEDTVGGKRSDTIMVLRLDPVLGRAAIMSLPRDLYVTIAGTNGKKNRINTAYSIGADALVRTVQDNFGITIQHYLEVDFQGFKRLVDELGGVTICFEYPTRDDNTGLNIPNPGCQSLGGTQALAFARSRHYKELRDGRWREDGTADLGRVKRQQDFLRIALDRSISKGLGNPLAISGLLDAVVGNVTVDASLTKGDMTRLARQFRSLGSDKLDSFTLPAAATTIRGMSVLVEDQAAAAAVLAHFR